LTQINPSAGNDRIGSESRRAHAARGMAATLLGLSMAFVTALTKVG